MIGLANWSCNGNLLSTQVEPIEAIYLIRRWMVLIKGTYCTLCSIFKHPSFCSLFNEFGHGPGEGLGPCSGLVRLLDSQPKRTRFNPECPLPGCRHPWAGFLSTTCSLRTVSMQVTPPYCLFYSTLYWVIQQVISSKVKRGNVTLRQAGRGWGRLLPRLCPGT